jgi:hypothetical protein
MVEESVKLKLYGLNVFNMDRAIRFLNSPNPSSRTMALGLSQSLTEMSIRPLPER